MSCRRIQADPLYNHSRRPTLSHQFGTTTGPTTAGRAHVTYETSYIQAQDENELSVDEDIDMEMPELGPVEDSDDEDDPIPSQKVVAIKEAAKRYGNSVSTVCYCEFQITNVIIIGRPPPHVDSLPR